MVKRATSARVNDAEKLKLLKRKLAAGLDQAEREEFSERSVMEIAQSVIKRWMKMRPPLVGLR